MEVDDRPHRSVTLSSRSSSELSAVTYHSAATGLRPAGARTDDGKGPRRPRIPRRREHGTASRSALLPRARRVAMAAAVVLLTAALASFASRMLEPSNSSFSIRSVEWLRSHGAAGLVSQVESIYYTLTAPSKGGPALRRLPHVGVSGAYAARPRGVDEYRPPRIAPLTRPALPGEGQWVATRPNAGPHAPLLVSTFRSEPSEYPRLVAGVAWIDSSRTRMTLYPGREEPAVELPSRGPMEVPPSARSGLLATFNSGFKLSDSNGGFALNGHTYARLRAGLATIVGYRDGRVNVVAWHSGEIAPRDVVFARQNLPLIVDNGRPNPNLNQSAEWGATLGNAVRVWRSGVGVDRRGNLIYAAANDQTVESLAHILIHAGAVRAMELDINSYWVTFNTYRGAGARGPQSLLGEMERPATRYLEPDDRDFFAVFER
jgi:hypothetical protein